VNDRDPILKRLGKINDNDSAVRSDTNRRNFKSNLLRESYCQLASRAVIKDERENIKLYGYTVTVTMID